MTTSFVIETGSGAASTLPLPPKHVDSCIFYEDGLLRPGQTIRTSRLGRTTEDGKLS